jgi:hypothetical protein
MRASLGAQLQIVNSFLTVHQVPWLAQHMLQK